MRRAVHETRDPGRDRFIKIVMSVLGLFLLFPVAVAFLITSLQEVFTRGSFEYGVASIWWLCMLCFAVAMILSPLSGREPFDRIIKLVLKAVDAVLLLFRPYPFAIAPFVILGAITAIPLFMCRAPSFRRRTSSRAEGHTVSFICPNISHLYIPRRAADSYLSALVYGQGVRLWQMATRVQHSENTNCSARLCCPSLLCSCRGKVRGRSALR